MEIDAPIESPSACTPPVDTLTRSVARVCRSRTKTSPNPFVSPGTRFDAKLWNAAWRPIEIEGDVLLAFPSAPAVARLTRSVVWAHAGPQRTTHSVPTPILA